VDIITLKNHVKELDISGNSIKKVDTYLVQTYYPELLRFDISRNRITRMFSTSPVDHSSLEVIDASFNYISELDPSAFSGASKLSELNVSNNEISNFSADTFASNPELVKLDVSRNHIFTIHRDAFRNNPKITEIYAGSNSLTYLHPGTFRENPRLSKVTVSWNRIQEIHPQTFYNNPNLEYLDFNSNKLQTLNPEVFHNNPRLKSVDLRSNALVTIHETTFQNNPKLEHLFVSRNEHIRFHNGLIILASSLKVFDAEHCNLTHLSVDLFKNTTDLRELRLGNNNLTSLDCITDTNSNDYVDTLTKLQVLDLANNQLQTINVEVLRNKMTDLKTLRIEGNPFLCDCKLRNVWLWSQKVGIIPSQPQITCTDVQQGTVPWDDVQHLNCSDESLTEESTSTVTFNRTEESSSTVTFIPTEDSTSKVRATHTEESTSAVTSTHTNLTTVSQQLKLGDKSRTEESVSAVTDVVTSMHNYLHSDRWRVHWPESSTIPQGSVLEMEEPHKLSLIDEQYSFTILIGILLFFLLAIVFIALPLILLLRRSYRIYEVSKAKSKMENNSTA
jgi:Leucine-rich repeat (LRR) protein